MRCPKCQSNLEQQAVECRVCGWEKDSDQQQQWVDIGAVESKMLADLAHETLASLQILAVVISRDGFLGNTGLSLNPFFKSGHTGFVVKVPAGLAVEANDAMVSTLGDQWQEAN